MSEDLSHDSEVKTQNQFPAAFEALEARIDTAQERVGEAEDALDDAHDIDPLAENVEALEDAVDDAQDADDYDALTSLAADVQDAQAAVNDLQEDVGFDTPAHAEAVEAVEEAVEGIEDALAALTAGYVVVVDNIPLVYHDEMQVAEDLMLDSGTDPDKVDQKELVAYTSPDGEKVTTWPHHAEVDLSEDDRTFFEVHPKGSGRS